MLLKKIALEEIFKKKFKRYINLIIQRKNISIISNNCSAAFLYKHFGCKYFSPTINLQMSPSDYLKFSKNFEYYLSIEIEEIKNPEIEPFKMLGGTTIDFPVGKLGDLIIYFQHYESFDVAKRKWDERKLRINFKSLFFILVDTNCDKETVLEFLSLPCKNKLFLTENKNLIIDDNCKLLKLDGKPWYNSDWINQCNFRKYFLFFK